MNPVMEALRTSINNIHQLMQVLPDAQHVQLANQSLAPLLKMQAELSQTANQSNPRQALLQSIAGGQNG